MNTPPPPVPGPCLEPIYVPPMHCTLSKGHGGNHSTSMIPEVLSGVAADMLTQRDRLNLERAEFAAERESWSRRLHWLWAGNCAVLISAIAVIIHALSTIAAATS